MVAFGVLVASAVMGAGIASVRGDVKPTKLADTGVEQGYEETFKVNLGGEEVNVTGVGQMGATENKNVRQRDLTGKQLVALTFDDGPDAENTEKILNTLREKEVRATFFMVGIMIERAPEMAKKVAEAGHEVETHSMRHANLTEMDSAGVAGDLAEMQKTLGENTGVKAEILRPPYGAVNDTVKEAAKMPMISWSVDPYDWRDRDAGLIKDRVVGASYDGAIILLHDIYPDTAEAVGWMIDELREKGFEFATVKELATQKGITLEAGEMYRELVN